MSTSKKGDIRNKVDVAAPQSSPSSTGPTAHKPLSSSTFPKSSTSIGTSQSRPTTDDYNQNQRISGPNSTGGRGMSSRSGPTNRTGGGRGHDGRGNNREQRNSSDFHETEKPNDGKQMGYLPTRTSSAPPDEHAGGFSTMRKNPGFKPTKTFGKFGNPNSENPHQPSQATIAQYIPLPKEESRPSESHASNPPSSIQSPRQIPGDNPPSSMRNENMTNDVIPTGNSNSNVVTSSQDRNHSGNAHRTTTQHSNGPRQPPNIPTIQQGPRGPPDAPHMGGLGLHNQGYQPQIQGPNPQMQGGPRGPSGQNVGRSQQYPPQNPPMGPGQGPPGPGPGPGFRQQPHQPPMGMNMAMARPGPMAMGSPQMQMQMQPVVSGYPQQQAYYTTNQMTGAVYQQRPSYPAVMVPSGGQQGPPQGFVLAPNMSVGAYGMGVGGVPQMQMAPQYMTMNMDISQQQYLQQQQQLQMHQQQQQQQQSVSSSQSNRMPHQQQHQLPPGQQQMMRSQPPYAQQQVHNMPLPNQSGYAPQAPLTAPYMMSMDMNRGRPPGPGQMVHQPESQQQPAAPSHQMPPPQVPQPLAGQPISGPSGPGQGEEQQQRKKPVLKDKSGRVIEYSQLTSKDSKDPNSESTSTTSSSSSHIIRPTPSHPTPSTVAPVSKQVVNAGPPHSNSKPKPNSLKSPLTPRSAAAFSSSTATASTQDDNSSSQVVSTAQIPTTAPLSNQNNETGAHPLGVAEEEEKKASHIADRVVEESVALPPPVEVSGSVNETLVQSAGAESSAPVVDTKALEEASATPLKDAQATESSSVNVVAAVSQPNLPVDEVRKEVDAEVTVTELPLTTSSVEKPPEHQPVIEPRDAAKEEITVVADEVVAEKVETVQVPSVEGVVTSAADEDNDGDDWEAVVPDLNSQVNRSVPESEPETVPVAATTIETTHSAAGVNNPPKKKNLKQRLAALDAKGDQTSSLLDAYTDAPPVPPPTTASTLPVAKPFPTTNQPAASPSVAFSQDRQIPTSRGSDSPLTISASKPETEEDWDGMAEKMSSESKSTPTSSRSLRPMGGIGKKLNEGPKSMFEKSRPIVYSKDDLIKLRPSVLPDKPIGFNFYNSMPPRTEPSEDPRNRVAPMKGPGVSSVQEGGGQRWQKQGPPPGYAPQGPVDRSFDPMNGANLPGMMPGVGPGGLPLLPQGQVGPWQRGLAQAVPQQSPQVPRQKRPPPAPMPKKVISDPLEILTRDVQAILNKITPQTFQKLTQQLCEIPIDTNSMLDRLIYLVFEKAIQEPNFANLYADMCLALENESRYWSFLQVAFNKDSNQYIWMKDLVFDKELAGPYSSPKDCISAALGQTPPPMQPMNTKVQVNEVIITSGVLVKIFKTMEGEEYFFSFLPFSEIESSNVSQKAFPTQTSAEKDATSENSFRRRLVRLCQEEFFASVNIESKYKEVEDLRKKFDQEAHSMPEDERAYHLAELEDLERKVKRRMLGNMRFIGELYKKSLLKSGIMYECFQSLLERKNMKDEEIELLCKLLHTVGASLESKASSKKPKDIDEKKKMDELFDKIGKLAADKSLNSRMRFSLEEVISLRANNWQSRREQEGPATIEEIHEKIAREESLKKSQGQFMAAAGRGAGRYNMPVDAPIDNLVGRDRVERDSIGYGGRGGGYAGGGRGAPPINRTISTDSTGSIRRQDSVGSQSSVDMNNRPPRIFSEPHHRRGGSRDGSGSGSGAGFGMTGGIPGSISILNNTERYPPAQPVDTYPAAMKTEGERSSSSNDSIRKDVKGLLEEMIAAKDVREAVTSLSTEMNGPYAFETGRILVTMFLNLKSTADANGSLLLEFIDSLTPVLIKANLGEHIEHGVLSCEEVINIADTTVDVHEAPELLAKLISYLIRMKLLRRDNIETQLRKRKDQSLADEFGDVDQINRAYTRLFDSLN